MSDVRSIRQGLPALTGLSERVLGRVVSAATNRRYAARAVLYRAGDAPSALYFVLAGRVRVARAIDGASPVLHFEGPGGVLGEIPLFGGGPYPATATAVQPVRCAVLSADVVERLLREEPEFARFALARIARRARVLLQRLDELSSYTVTARLAAYLLAQARRPGTNALDLGMTQAALADHLGTAREVLVRSLRALCAAGAIRRAGRSHFLLVDVARLRAAARPRSGA